MIPYVLYDLPTGRILARGTTLTLEDARLQIRTPAQEVALFVEADARTHYMVDGVISPRPSPPEFNKTIILADGVDRSDIDFGDATIEVVSIDGQSQNVSGSRMTVSTTAPGTYKIEITAFPFTGLVAEIIATET